MFPETKQGRNIENDAWKNAPESAFCEALHNVRVSIVFDVHPNKHEDTGKRHNGDESRRGRKSLTNRGGNKNYCEAYGELNDDLH